MYEGKRRGGNSIPRLFAHTSPHSLTHRDRHIHSRRLGDTDPRARVLPLVGSSNFLLLWCSCSDAAPPLHSLAFALVLLLLPRLTHSLLERAMYRESEALAAHPSCLQPHSLRVCVCARTPGCRCRQSMRGGRQKTVAEARGRERRCCSGSGRQIR